MFIRSKQLRGLRRTMGIAALERTSRVVDYAGRRCKAWRVPGTVEAGRHAALVAAMRRKLAETK